MCDFTAISGSVDKSSKWVLCTTYGLKHVIKYHTAIKWADGRATVTYFCENRPKMLKISSRKCMAILGSVDTGQHCKSSIWFLCTTYDLKNFIEYQKGDKMSI